MWRYNYPDELCHHGVLGMRWGIRRNRSTSSGSGQKKSASEINKQATYKAAKIKARSKIKASKIESKTKVKKAKLKEREVEAKKRTIKEMSDDELRQRINRIQLEQQYSRLNPAHVSKGQKFVNSLTNDVLIPAAKEGAKDLAKKLIVQQGGKALGIKPEVKKVKKQPE